MVANKRSQRIIDSLAAAERALHALMEAERTGAAGGVELLEGVIAYAKTVVEQSDGDLITDNAVTLITQHADAIATDPNGPVASARAYADAILSGAALVPAARDRDVEQAVRDAAANFQRSTSQRLRAIETEAERSIARLRESIDDLNAQLQEAAEKTTTATQEQADAFSARLTEVEEALTAQEQRMNAALERQSATFSEKQEGRATAFEDELGQARLKLRALLDQSTKEVEKRVQEIRRMEEESSGLVHSIGLGGTAERYGDEAEAQKKVADGFRWLTVTLALGAVAMAIFAVLHNVEDNSVVLAKLGVSAVFGGLATYTARQSGRHRKREERARNLQLELTAFAPFIEPLGDDVKEVERVLMTRKTFGNIAALPEGDDGSDHSYSPLGPVLDMIQKRFPPSSARRSLGGRRATRAGSLHLRRGRLSGRSASACGSSCSART